MKTNPVNWILIICFFTAPVFASGSLSGKVIDGKTSSGLEGANITIAESGIGTASGFDGKFFIADINSGRYQITVSYIGYKQVQKEVFITDQRSTSLIIYLEPATIDGESIIVTARPEPNHAAERLSPVAFSRIQKEELKVNYATGDLPDLLKTVPGVWSSTAGLGESEMFIRGFPSSGIRIMINDIVINNPEDHQVVWSDWSGLSHIAQSVEIQRGPGYSLYSTNSMGGTVNISTIGLEPFKRTTFRVSAGMYNRMGISQGLNQGKVYDPVNDKYLESNEWPVQYTYSGRFNSGPMYDGKLNLCLFFERKSGNSYIQGTNYSGYTIGLEGESQLSRVHHLYFIFFINPQSHGQAFALQDIDLLPVLGREYNRKNHEWQENYYTKPFGSLKHDWHLSDTMLLTNNVFFTFGRGADQTMANDVFNTGTGELSFQPVMRGQDAYDFGMHAQYLYHNFNLLTTDFVPAGYTFVFKDIPFEDRSYGEGANFFADQHMHSFQYRKRRDHWQIGAVSYINHTLNHKLFLDYGVNLSYWRGHREGEMNMLKISKIEPNRSLWTEYPDAIFVPYVQSIYNFDTDVLNLGVFARFTWQFSAQVTIQGGIPFSYSRSEVIENPIPLMDFGRWDWFPEAKRTTADMVDFGPKFSITNDYLRQWVYVMPWLGGNYNINKNWNLFSRFATARKEPSILDWYDYSSGPVPEKEYHPDNPDATSLHPESVIGLELGAGYQGSTWKINANYYYSLFRDKIETVIDIDERRKTINAGNAVYQGIESIIQYKYKDYEIKLAATLARNRWQKMDVKEIFDSDAANVTRKVVPFAPERILSAALGYDYQMSANNSLWFGLKINYWHEYYGTYTNDYVKSTEVIIDRAHYTVLTTQQAKLPYYLDISAQVAYTLKTTALDFHFRIDVNNMLNRSDNFMRAQYSIDFTRDDFQAGKYNWYVLQAPLFNIFFTTEIGINSI